MRHLFKLIGLWVACVLVAHGGMLAPAPVEAQDNVTWLLGQINTLRGGLSLHGYALNGQLSAAAAQHSRYMADNCTVSHFWADGTRASDRARAQGYTGGWISENIYGGKNARAADAWNFWINSPIHYQGLTHKIVNEVGIGIAQSGCGQYFTLVFGKRDGISAPAAPAASAGSGASNAAAPPPTRVPYVPPSKTPTPTPTIPTLTPSATWTITPSATTSPTPSVAPPTGTPLVLPTVPALDATTPAAPTREVASTAVAQIVSPTATTLPPTPARTASPPPDPDSESDPAFDLRLLIPVALVGQMLLVSAAAYVYWRRSA